MTDELIRCLARRLALEVTDFKDRRTFGVTVKRFCKVLRDNARMTGQYISGR